MDIASLGLSITSDGVVVATDRLKDFEKAAGGADKEADKLSGSMKRLAGVAGTIAGALAAAFSVRAITQASDAYTEMVNKLRLVSGAQSDVNGLLKELSAVAARTRAPLDGVVTLYQRASMAGRDLGVSQADILEFTENIGRALALQGGSAQSASGALLQLSQALGAGVVRAEEFNSIIEGAYPIALAAAKGIDEAGGSVSRLRTLIAEGKITSDEFFTAILSQSADLEARFSMTTGTVSQGMQRISDAFVLMIGAFDSATGGSAVLAGALGSVADAMMWLANHAQDAQGYLIAASVAMVSYFAPSIYAGVVAVGSLVASLITLRGVLITTGIGAFIVLAGMAINKFLDLVRATGGLGEAMKLLGEVAAGVWEGIVISAGAIPIGLNAVWYRIKAAFTEMIVYLIQKWRDFLSLLNTTMGPLAVLVPGFRALGAAVNAGTEAAAGKIDDLNASIEGFNALADSGGRVAEIVLARGINTATDALGKLKTSVEDTSTALAGDGEVTLPDAPGAGGGGKGGGKGGKSLKDAFTELQGSLAVDIATAQQEYADGLAILHQAYQAQMITRAEYHAMIEGMQEQHVARLAMINQQARDVEFQAQNQMYGALAGALSAFGQQSKSAALAALAINTWISIRETLQNAMVASWQAWKAAGPVAGPAAAARVMAMGKASAAFIAAQGVGQALSMGGSGSVGGGSTAASSASTPAAAPARPQEVILDFTSADPALRAIAQVLAPEMIRQLQKASKVGVNVVGARF